MISNDTFFITFKDYFSPLSHLEYLAKYVVCTYLIQQKVSIEKI